MSSVRVAVRARPFSELELASHSWLCVEMTGKNTTLYSCGEGPTPRGSAKEFLFDYSYWSVRDSDSHYAGQEQLYTDLGLPAIKAAFAGYNSCIFAYGQTGSGKTHTMTGCSASPGLIPRICEGLFAGMELGAGSHSAVSYKTELSYMEIYNEKVRDLLACRERGMSSLRVRQHPKDGPYVENLSHHEVWRHDDVATLLASGNSQRATASTKMNSTSSRSHAIFTLTITQAVYECGLPSETRSKLNLVDLAGSERASATGSEGLRLKEGSSINKSLVCLGTVISALADKGGSHGNKYIPYRDSVLTYLLKDSLGGNAKTVMIATVSPSASSYGETLSTLRYASRARAIINKPVVNEDSGVKVIRQLRSEIERLKALIATQQLSSDVTTSNTLSGNSGSLVADLHEKEEQAAELTKEWASKWSDMQHILKSCEVALHSEGARLVVHSEQPHLVGVDPDILSTGLVFFYLKGDCTTVGSTSASPPPDIVVSGADVADQHCKLVVKRGRVTLHPVNGECYINRGHVTNPSRLRQGDMVQLGSSAVFRFNHPQEARRLRRRHSCRGGLLDQHVARQHWQRRERVRSASHPQPPAQTVSVMELRSQATILASEPTPPVSSFTSSGQQLSWASHLSLPLAESQQSSEQEWNIRSLIKVAMSPLTLFNTAALAPATQPKTAITEVILESEVPPLPQSASWWRRILCTFVLLCGLLWRCWLFQWMATVVTLLTITMLAPVTGLYSLAIRGCSFLVNIFPSSQRNRKPA